MSDQPPIGLDYEARKERPRGRGPSISMEAVPFLLALSQPLWFFLVAYGSWFILGDRTSTPIEDKTIQALAILPSFIGTLMGTGVFVRLFVKRRVTSRKLLIGMFGLGASCVALAVTARFVYR
jgi:hypothetical protein